MFSGKEKFLLIGGAFLACGNMAHGLIGVFYFNEILPWMNIIMACVVFYTTRMLYKVLREREELKKGPRKE